MFRIKPGEVIKLKCDTGIGFYQTDIRQTVYDRQQLCGKPKMLLGFRINKEDYFHYANGSTSKTVPRNAEFNYKKQDQVETLKLII